MYDSLSRTFAGIQYVWLGISIFLLVLLLLSRTKIFRNALSQERYTKREYIIFTVIFTILGLCGTFWNFRTPGGIMTFRAVPIMLSGFIGGPIVGTIKQPQLLLTAAFPFYRELLPACSPPK